MTEVAPRPQSSDVSPALAAMTESTGPMPPADLARLYRDGFAYVYSTLRRLGVRERDLEDRTHDVFLVVHRHLADFDPRRPLRPWLFGIAFRVAAGERRRAGHQAEIPTAAVDAAALVGDAEADVSAGQERALVLRALAGIDVDQRAVLILHDIDGCPAPAIASTLGVPLNTVYSRLRLARGKFADAVRRLMTAPRVEPGVSR